MKISVIIPTRNASRLLDGCLSRFYPINDALEEIIVVDCCSDDGIDEVLKRHATLPVVYLRGPDSGIYDAFNKGVVVARAPLVFFLGADDEIFNGLFVAARNFDAFNSDILVGIIRRGSSVEIWRPWLFGVHLLLRNIPHQGMIIKREILVNRPYSLKYPLLSDYAWNIRNFWSAEVRFKYCPQLFCDWGQDGLSNRQEDSVFKRDKQELINESAPFYISALYSLIRILKGIF